MSVAEEEDKNTSTLPGLLKYTPEQRIAVGAIIDALSELESDETIEVIEEICDMHGVRVAKPRLVEPSEKN